MNRELFDLSQPVEMRWLNPENYDGSRGAGGKTNHGRKGSACRGKLKAGETWVLGEGQGNGTIRRMWITVSQWTPAILRGLVLRMYWDGAKKPAVEAPLADFFGNALGRRFAFASEWFNNPEKRNWNTTLPMPFRKSFRITVTNESPDDEETFWYHIDYTLGDRHGPKTGYLHAYWNRENPTTLRRDFQILPRVTGRGRYLGCVLGLITRPYYNTWWGEGEVKIYLDGDKKFPTLCGTGTEDYICTAWGTGSYSLPWYGCQFLPVTDPDRLQVTMYRWHGPDPVYFRKEIRVELQQIGYWGGEASVQQMRLTGQREVVRAGDGRNTVSIAELLAKSPALTLFEREDDWCATAFFYLDRPTNDLPAIAPYAARVADLTGEPKPVDVVRGKLEWFLKQLPAAKDIAAWLRAGTPEKAAVASRIKFLESTHRQLQQTLAEATAPELKPLLKRLRAAGLVGPRYVTKIATRAGQV
jgi:hypothetical protein